MPDSLLTTSLKSKLLSAIKNRNYRKVVSLLETIKTPHAGTAKTRDKAFVLYEIIKNLKSSYMSPKELEKSFYETGYEFSRMNEPVAKEIGISLIWRGYQYDKTKVKEALIKVADHPNWEVREYAAGAFINTLKHNPDFYKTLTKWSQHSSANVRRAVVFSSLGFLSDKQNLRKAFALLKPLLYDSSTYVKRNLGPFILGSYFGRKYPVEVFKQFDKWIRLKTPNVRWNIAMSFRSSLGNKHPKRALKYLKQLSKDESKTVLRAVKSAMNFLGKTSR
jgi:3-methyladenine DNA glycosylase AlkD